MTVEIPLTKGYVAIVDDEDADLAQFRWIAIAGGYAVRGLSKPRRQEHMHRAILERSIGRSLESHELCDHIDGNPLNNRRGNLRPATSSENARNTKKRRTSTSPYKGITRSHSGNWVAQIYTKGRKIVIGVYPTPEDAHEAYKAKARELFGDFARFE